MVVLVAFNFCILASNLIFLSIKTSYNILLLIVFTMIQEIPQLYSFNKPITFFYIIKHQAGYLFTFKRHEDGGFASNIIVFLRETCNV